MSSSSSSSSSSDSSSSSSDDSLVPSKKSIAKKKPTADPNPKPTSTSSKAPEKSASANAAAGDPNEDKAPSVAKPKRSKLIEDSAEESNSENEKSGDDEEEEEKEGDKNEYEKDGFVVSDDEDDSDEDESEAEGKSKKRKRKRLRKGRQFVADEDDIALIKEANNEEVEAADARDAPANDAFLGDGDIDSDDMDDFIVDDTNRSAADKRKRRMNKKRRQGSTGVSEEQNAEFAEIFGYSKEEFEAQSEKTSTTEREYTASTVADRETVRRELKKKIDDHYEFSERAENYMLEADEEIRKLDMPERICLKEQKLKLKRSKKTNGEFFLRIDKESSESIEKQAEDQRRWQGEWVYQQLFQLYKRRLGESVAETNCPPKYDLIEPIIATLRMMQVEMLEVPFICFYRREKVRPLTLEDLWDIFDLSYDYYELIVLKQSTLDLINAIVPADAEDEQVSLFVSKPDEDMMDVDMKDSDDDEEEETKPREYAKWKDRLVQELQTVQSKLTANYLRGLQDYLKFRFGSTTSAKATAASTSSSSSSAPPTATGTRTGKDDGADEGKSESKEAEIDALFGDGDSSDSENDQAPSQSQAASAKQVPKAPQLSKLKQRKELRDSLYQLQKAYPGVKKVCNCIGSIPHFAMSVEQEKRLPSVLIMSPSDRDNPNLVAEEFLKDAKAEKMFENPSGVFFTVVHAMAKEISLEPRVKEYCRNLYRSNGTITTRPTKKGFGVAGDPAHEYMSVLQLENKPFNAFAEADMMNGRDYRDQFLLIAKAQKEGFIQVEVNQLYLITCISIRFADAFFSDEGAGVFKRSINENQTTQMHDFSGWDQFRSAVINLSLKKYLGKWIAKAMKAELMERAKDHVARNCASSLFDRLTVAPCQMPMRRRENLLLPDAWFVHPGLMHVMGLYLTEDANGFAVILNGDGAVVDFLKLYPLLKRHDLEQQLQGFIEETAPHLVVMNDTAGLRGRGIYLFLTRLCQDKCRQEQEEAAGKSARDLKHVDEEDDKVPHNAHRIFLPMIVETYIASAFAASSKAAKEFPDYAMNQRRAISMARLIQDPLLEIANLWMDPSRGDNLPASHNTILNVSLHPLQSMLSAAALMKRFERALINATALVGVDINYAINHRHARSTLQFVPGLGSRKAIVLLDAVERSGKTVGKRSAIRQALEHMTSPHARSSADDPAGVAAESGQEEGGSVTKNAIAFLRAMDRDRTMFDEDDADVYDEDRVEFAPLDNTRIHPDDAKLAALICWAAASKSKEMPGVSGDEDLPDDVEDCVRKVIKSSVDVIKKQLHGDIYFLNIRSSAKWDAFKTTGNLIGDQGEEARWALDGDLLASVDLDAINQVCKEQLLWEDKSADLLFCVQELRFPFAEYRRELRVLKDTEVFDLLTSADDLHIGSEVTVRIVDFQGKFVNCRLASGIRASIHVSELSDDPGAFRRVHDERDLETAVHEALGVGVNDDILARVVAIQKDRFSLRLSARESKADELFMNELRPTDFYWKKSEVVEFGKAKKATKAYKNRLITHPNFENISKEEAETLLKERIVGDFIIRPASRGVMFLSVSWKISEKELRSFTIEELDKKSSDLEISKKLRINNEMYEDLDEIIARYITPINAFVKDVHSSEKFKAVDFEAAQTLCQDAKKANPQRIPYFFIPYPDFPGAFVLVYQPGRTVRKAKVNVVPEGFKFEQEMFVQLDKLIAYFKKNYNRIGQPKGKGSSRRGYSYHSNSRSRDNRSYQGSRSYQRYDDRGSGSGSGSGGGGYRSRDSGRRY